jgi:hypothetical protein
VTEINLKPYFDKEVVTASAELKLDAGVISVVYSFSGDEFQSPTGDKKLMQRQDYLYENTCFELFLKPKNGEHYYEYHFALSGALNGYSLTHYRSPLTPLTDIVFKEIKLELISDRSLRATLPLPESKDAKDYLINVTAVYKNNIRTQYYALSHGKEKADFHDQKQFLELIALI